MLYIDYNIFFQGPVLAWLNAIEAYIETGNELPINLRVRAINMVTCKLDLTVNLVVK